MPSRILDYRRPCALAALAALLGGCTVALQREHEQCRTSQDCRHLSELAVCTSDGLCESLASESASSGCSNDLDCPGRWSVCYSKACRQLDQTPCVGIGAPDTVKSAERLPFAVLVPDKELSAAAKRLDKSNAPTVGVAETVLEAFTTARKESASVPQVVGVACPETDPAALQLLKDAGVRLVIGPMQGDAVLAVSEALSQQAVLFAASADAPLLLNSRARPASHIVSCKPNSGDTRLAQVAAMTFVQGQLSEAGLLAAGRSAVVARSHDEARFGYVLNNPVIPEVEYDASLQGEGLASALATKQPTAGLIAAASGLEDWSHNLKEVEAARQIADLEPAYYLLRDKQASTLDLLATAPKGLAQRSAGLAFALSEAASANRETFDEAYAATTGNQPRVGLEYLHDCLYVAIYAAFAAQQRFGMVPRELSAEAVLLGLDALVGGEQQVNVSGPEITRALELLQSGHGLSAALDLVGGSGDLDFEASLLALQVIPAELGTFIRPAAGDLELYCLDPKDSQVCDSTLRFPTTGEPAQGASQCDCFPRR